MNRSAAVTYTPPTWSTRPSSKALWPPQKVYAATSAFSKMPGSPGGLPTGGGVQRRVSGFWNDRARTLAVLPSQTWTRLTAMVTGTPMSGSPKGNFCSHSPC